MCGVVCPSCYEFSFCDATVGNFAKEIIKIKIDRFQFRISLIQTTHISFLPTCLTTIETQKRMLLSQNC